MVTAALKTRLTPDAFIRDQITGLRTFAASLDAFDHENPALFQKLVEVAIDSYQVTPAALADAFGVSRGTISRWASGKTVPHQMVRPMIVRWIREHTLAKADELEQQVDAHAA